jgi:hypothetical protein
MSAAEYELKQTEPEARDHVAKFVGGAAAVTKVFGKGMTITYVSTGVVKIAWTDTAENPGTFIGVKGFAFQATTPGNVKGYTMVHEAFVARSGTTPPYILLNMYESGTLADLAALEWLTVTLAFKEASA